jgi:RimJ/RimL family protein N-acetyltransferase
MSGLPEAAILTAIPVLRDGSLVLRPVEERDVDAYVAAFVDDPELGRWAGFQEDPNEEWVRTQLAKAAERRAAGDFAELAIADAGSDAFIGALALHHFGWRSGRLELGVWVVPGARRRGVARGALTLLLDWLVDEAGFRRVELHTTPDNERMCGLAERLGFAREGVLREREIERGVPVSVVAYGLLRDEWQADR